MSARNQGSEAYDLSLFEPKKAKLVALEPNKKMIKAEKRRLRLHSILNTALTLFVAAAVVGIVGMMITSRVQLTEMNSQIIAKQAELKQQEDKFALLSAQLSEQTSAQSVDEYAAAAGMQKAEAGQIDYITVDGGDNVEVSDTNNQNWFEQIASSVTKFFSDLAYLLK